MISTPWDAASPLYKWLVVVSMSSSAIGILLAIVGAATENRALMYPAVAIIMAGLLTHTVGLMVRGRDVRAYRKLNPPTPQPPRVIEARKTSG